MKRSHFALLSLSLALTACSSQLRQAPVIERTPLPAAAPAPVVAEPPPKVDAKGTYTVRKGDTLIRIALDHGLNYRDLAAWNNLADPDDIKVDQVLRTEAPAHPVVTTAKIDMPPPTKVAAVPDAPRKTGPKADKKPYTDATLAEMQKADAAAKAEATAAPAAGASAAAAPAIQAGSTVTATDDEKLSWMWPADGKIIATFDEGKNKGIDISGKPGQAVLSAGAGKVMYAGAGIRGYGNLVIVKHSNSLLSAYAHNQKIVVKEGDEVKKGQQLAEMGSSDADQVKLHFEIRQQGKPVDPTKFLPSR